MPKNQYWYDLRFAYSIFAFDTHTDTDLIRSKNFMQIAIQQSSCVFFCCCCSSLSALLVVYFCTSNYKDVWSVESLLSNCMCFRVLCTESAVSAHGKKNKWNVRTNVCNWTHGAHTVHWIQRNTHRHTYMHACMCIRVDTNFWWMSEWVWMWIVFRRVDFR